jgi:DNA helicase-2/ATP-dependent DNA helicase PcrA
LVTSTLSSGASGPVPGLEDDAEAARIVGEELKLLSTVRSALEDAGRADVSAAQGRVLDEERMLELRDHLAVAKPEDLPALFEQMHTLGALRAQRGRSVTGSVDAACPYFGHLRLEEDVPGAPPAGAAGPSGRPATRRRDVLIGSRSYVNARDGIRIVDWRNAPVSRIYYRYGEGDGYEEQFGDHLVEGVVVTRRGLSISHGELVRVSAPQGTFVRGKDGMWRRAAVRAARLETEKKWQAGGAPAARLGTGEDGQTRQDKHLPAIAALLDQKQFDLIAQGTASAPGGGDAERGPNTVIVAIQGSAGSGKTTVGLHRLAYLAFQEPQRFRPEKMLVVVPTVALMHYVSRVLPSLGVEGTPSTTFARFAARLVMQLLPRLPTKTSEETPAVVSRAKSHPAMLRGIEHVVARLEADVEQQIRGSMARWPGGGLVEAAWQATHASGAGEDTPPDLRVSLASQWLGGKRTLSGVAAASSLPEVTRSAFEQLLSGLRSRTRQVSALWDELLTSRQLLGEIFAPSGAFSPSQLDQVHEWCVRQTRIRVEGEREGDEASLDPEDFALILRCWQALRGPLLDAEGKPLRFAHIFVDEVQDASPIELRVLLELTGRERSITLAGDVAQRMLDEGDGRGEFDWNALLDDLGAPHTRLEPLHVSYRSTAEITHFARAVLGPLSHDVVPEATRQGPPVELFQFASAGEAVAWLAEVLKQLARDEPDANVAIVARFPQQADVYFDGLARAEVVNVRRVAKQDFAWEPGVDVTDVRQTKGLEFDEVVLVETTAASYPVTPAARHALYVGATRASHQLWCVTSEAPSELVTAALSPPAPLAGAELT